MSDTRTHQDDVATADRQAPGADSGLLIDRTRAHAARMYDYLLGGSTNFAVDRDAVERAAVAIGGIENARVDVRANRAFLGRAVRYMAGEASIRQFLDIGTGIPNVDDTHAVAQKMAPESRVVYVDNDPIVLAHAHYLLWSTPEGATAYVNGDLRDPGDILLRAEATLDFEQPVGLMLVAILHLIPDDENPHGIVARLVDALPAGSYVAISHLTADFAPEAMAELSSRLNQASKDTFVMRDRTAFSRFLEGLELVDPGVVRVDRWRPDPSDPAPASEWVPSLYGAVARKPGS
jgi:S-adenosyl methyltransferase